LVTLLTILLSFPLMSLAGLLAEWRMDGCVWNGTSGEVVDSSGGGYAGHGVNGAETRGRAPFVLCGHGEFTGKYVELESRPSLGESWTLSVWIEFPLTPVSDQFLEDDYYYFTLASVEGTGDLGYFAREKEGELYKWGVYDNGGGKEEITDLSIAAGWHHVVEVVENGRSTLYIDGNEIGTVGRYTRGTLQYLATSTDGEENRTIGASMDEFKLFDQALSDEEVSTIYRNEKEGRNYDGSARACVFCPYELAAEYRMDECRWTGMDGEVEDGSGNGFDLTALNGTNTEEGRVCRSGYFDALDDKVEGTWNYTFHNAVTLTAWIRTEGGHKSYARVVEFSSHDGDYRYGTALAYDGAGKVIRGWTANSDPERSETVAYDLAANGMHDGTWHFLAFVYDGTRAKLYVDDVKVDEKETDISDIDDPSTLVIGGYYPNTDHGFKGDIDEVKIFATALDDLQLRSIYENEKNGKHFDGSMRECKCLHPMAEYRMDECLWNGTENEVEESSGHGYRGTAKGGALTMGRSVAGGGLCHVGSFDGSDDYIELENFPHLNGSRTVTGWFKTKDNTRKGQRIFADDEVNDEGNYAVSVGDPGTGKVRFYIRGLDPVSLDSDAVVENDTWYFVAAVFDAETMTKYLTIYDAGGEKIDEVSQVVSGALSTPGGTPSIGGETAQSAESSRKFFGELDEVKIFDGAMVADQIDMIVSNERAMKNYDGSSRFCPCCAAREYDGPVTPLQFEGKEVTLNNTTSSPHWTHVSFQRPFDVLPVVFIVPETYGSHPASTRIKNVTREGFDAIMAEPQGEDGPHYPQAVSYFAINPGIHRIGTTLFEVGKIDTKKYQQASQGRSTHDEWEKVETVFSECSPATVAAIQSLTNEEGLDIPDADEIVRSTPWMTAAVESNNTGLFLALERSETDEGNITGEETIGYMVAESNVQDGFTDDEGRTIVFETLKKGNFFRGWDDGCKVASFVQRYTETPLIAGSKNSRFEKDGGWFRRCHLDETGIGFQIDEDGSAYSKSDYDYREPPQDRERSHRGEDGAVFVFSESFLIRESIVPNAYFDAWDTSGSIEDRNISTKVVGRSFELILAALTADGKGFLDFNGTVCTRVVHGRDGRPMTGWDKHFFGESNLTRLPLTLSSASSEAALQIVWKRNVDESCPLSGEDNTTLSTDRFAVRPERFVFLAPASDANLTAERLYRYSGGVGAVAADGTFGVTDYNTTVLVRTVKRMRNGEENGSLAGSLTIDLSRFENGMADLNLSFDDVAFVTLELNDTRWCAVDFDDTPETNRTIYGERNVTFVPAYFELTFPSMPVMEDNDTIGGFTYLSEDMNMSARVRGIGLEIRAKGANGRILRNFSVPMDRLFADPVNVIPAFRLPTKHSPPTLLGIPESAMGEDLGFLAGLATLTYSDVAFNYDRQYDVPVAPFHMNGNEGNISVSVQDATYPSVVGGVESAFAGGATFYYGRIRAEDVRTSERNVENPIELEVYDDNASVLVTGFRRNSLHWYRNERHRSRMNGGVLDAEANEEVTLPGSPDRKIVFGLDRYGKGILSMEINTTTERPRRRTVHLKIDRWLWYVPKGFGESYSYDVSSDCIHHPCFEYTYLGTGTGRGVRSGEIEGSDFDVEVLDANATYERRRGVKLFR
ncbi:LamG-like jellyroll fold domain-containing protein, partial [Hydrogenimonas sp.]